MFHVPNKFRVRGGDMGSSNNFGNNGLFIIPHPGIKNYVLVCIASDGALPGKSDKWEHVSVHVDSKHRYVDRCPTWAEMCLVKSIFWDANDCVMQYHPAEKDYVSTHNTTLHLWRPVDRDFPVPDPAMVGVVTGQRL